MSDVYLIYCQGYYNNDVVIGFVTSREVAIDLCRIRNADEVERYNTPDTYTNRKLYTFEQALHLGE